MFDQLVESSATRKRSRTWFYFLVTAAVWITGLSGALVFGVMAYEAKLPELVRQTRMVGPLSSSSVNPPAQRISKGSGSRVLGFVAPVRPPIGFVVKAPPDIEGIGPVGPGVNGAGLDQTGGGGFGIPDGPGSGGTDVGDSAPRPIETRVAVTKPDIETTTKPVIRKSGGVIQGSAIHRPSPAYPKLAVIRGQSGQVVVEVVVDENGRVIAARALTGTPLFRHAAEEAARRWRWNPTRLSGAPVQVVGTITFNFTLE